MAKTKALISFAVTARLICVFFFAYAKSRFLTKRLICLFELYGELLEAYDFQVETLIVELIYNHTVYFLLMIKYYLFYRDALNDNIN